MSRIAARIAIGVFVLALAFVLPAGAKGPPSGGETTNNLSYPAIATDGFTITPLAAPSFTVTYPVDATDIYSGLTDEELAYVLANGPWYPQKTTGNVWQADFATATGSVDVTYIDWGDNVESVQPKVRSPFRLEVTLYKALAEPMTGYTMAVLEYPSSSNELQGTNTTTYEGTMATVISSSPKLVVQYLGSSVPADMTWQGTQWSAGTVVPVSFAPELNVGGKYIYGASQGGFKPTQAGYYRITFFIPGGNVNLGAATIVNASGGFTPPSEGVTTAQISAAHNLTYVDVLAKAGGGGRRP